MTTIHQIDSILITILMDNSTDFLLTNSSHAIRPQLIKTAARIIKTKEQEISLRYRRKMVYFITRWSVR